MKKQKPVRIANLIDELMCKSCVKSKDGCTDGEKLSCIRYMQSCRDKNEFNLDEACEQSACGGKEEDKKE
jgi:hypothetical protein